MKPARRASDSFTVGKRLSIMEISLLRLFKNTSGQPFTTGPVSILMAEDSTNTEMEGMETDKQPRKKNYGNNFMVQGLMKFTGLNKMATIEVTKALDVEGKFVVETSKDRKVEATKKVKDEDYELECIQKTGTVTITNMKNEEVKCKIDHLLYGHLETSEPMHIEVTERQTGHHDVNPTSKYVWEIKVPPKGKADLVFKYCIKEWKRAEQEQVHGSNNKMKKAKK